MGIARSWVFSDGFDYRIRIILIVVLLFSFLKVHAGTVSPELLEKIKSLQSSDTVSVVIKFRDKLDLAAFRQDNVAIVDTVVYRSKLINELHRIAILAQGAVQSLLPPQRSIRPKPTLWLINGMAAGIPVSMINTIALRPEVLEVDLDAEITLMATLAGVPSTPEWNLSAINAPALWALGYKGQGVVVANMDTGVDINHPDVGSKWRGGTNSWFDPYFEHSTPADMNGHGTETMGIMVGGEAGGSAIGVAPEAQWIAAKIFNDAGVATISAIHEAFQWLLDPDGVPTTDDAPDVVNGSWGIVSKVGLCDQEYIDDLHVLLEADIALSFAAGNSGPSANTGVSPANYRDAIAVGSVNESLDVAFFSSRGPRICEDGIFPDVVAPGVNIKTSTLTFGGVFPNSYSYVSGTSFAAPHVSGVLALLMSASPEATAVSLATAIRQSALDLDAFGQDTNTGWGFLDLSAAYFLLPIDTDGDGVLDSQDNCILHANAFQADSDGDLYGNRCDTDLDNSGNTDPIDFILFRNAYGTSDSNSDFNGDGSVDPIDYIIFRNFYGAAPGPSGYVR